MSILNTAKYYDNCVFLSDTVPGSRQGQDYWLSNRIIRLQFSAGETDFSPPQQIHTGCDQDLRSLGPGCLSLYSANSQSM